MKIACLQFAPKVGDVDNNLNRADAVLNRAEMMDLDGLDLLVLPELAFTGYNFSSLRDITPFLEHAGSGISSLWARTTALKYNCVVSVGYPEKADVSKKWPTGPEYYNSAIVVNGDGETVANYRKTFLYPIDEKWALEGKGFFHDNIPELGSTVMAICMDMNPYKFEAPWTAFELGFHILNVQANLVIITMAWMTQEDGRLFSRMPQEPDYEALAYWVRRLEPLIRDEDNDEEVIVVFCNRCGSEGNALYSGTSAVLGIKGGEVLLYGILGRGNKELLVVDTEMPPYAKLVLKPDDQADELDPMGRGARMSVDLSTTDSTAPSTIESMTASTAQSEVSGLSQTPSPDFQARAAPPKPTLSNTGKETGDTGGKSLAAKPEHHKPDIPKIETGAGSTHNGTIKSPSTPAAMSPLSSQTMSPTSPSVHFATGRKRPRPKSPRIQIPYTPSLDEISSAIALSAGSSNCSVAGSMASPGIPTPSHPSPVPLHLRPKVDSIPPSPAAYQHKATPYPGDEGGSVESTSTPITPFFGARETPMPPVLGGSPFSRQRSGRKDTPIEPGYSPILANSPWSASFNYTTRPSFKPLSSQLAITAMKSNMRSPAGVSAGKTTTSDTSEPNEDPTLETPSTAVPQTANPLTAIPTSAYPMTAVPLTAVPTQFPYNFPGTPHASETETQANAPNDRSKTPKPKERLSSPPHPLVRHLSTPVSNEARMFTRDPDATPKTSPKAVNAPLAAMYPPIPDPIFRPQSSIPICMATSDGDFDHRQAITSKGTIPIIASPSIFAFKFSQGPVAPSEPNAAKTSGDREFRSRPQQPSHYRSGRERTGRSRSLVDDQVLKFAEPTDRRHARSVSSSPKHTRTQGPPV